MLALLYVVSILPAGMSKLCVPSAHGGQKRVRDLLELDHSYQVPQGCWELNLGPLQDQSPNSIAVSEVRCPEPRASP